MVRELFGVEPDAWQLEALEAFPRCPRLAFKACKGPGKTAVLAWIGWNFMLTRPHAVGGCTSITGPNLKANLWTEFARWRSKSPLLQHAFEQTSTSIFCKDHPRTWKLEARTWPADADASQIGNALAGLHALYVLWLLDETGDYPEAIMPTCEAIFAGNPIEAHIVQAGNPTKLAGPLYKACVGIGRELWKVVEISADPDNPKRTPRVSVEHAREQIKLYGRDNPWVLVNIFGQFPPSNINSLIGPEEVEASFARMYREWDYRGAPRVLGVDVAREGDDASVIFPRQGLQCFPIQKFRNLDSLTGASQVVRKWNEWEADGCFVDATGGYGWGWIDQMRQLGKSPIPIQFAGEAHNKDRYYNKRAEMYFEAVEWIRRGGALLRSRELLETLTQTTYTFKGDRLILEEKLLIKEKLGYSPDECDAFVMTFAEPLMPSHTAKGPRRVIPQPLYDPFAEFDRMAKGATDSGGYDPFGR
jgi:hypothetical protein